MYFLEAHWWYSANQFFKLRTGTNRLHPQEDPHLVGAITLSNFMSCYICHEDILGSLENEIIQSCIHGYHVGCLYSWFYSQGSTERQCLICTQVFEHDEAKKLGSFKSIYEQQLYEHVRMDNLESFMNYFFIDPRLYDRYWFKILEAAITTEAKDLSKYLRKLVEDVMRTREYEKERLMLRVFQLRTRFAVRWIADNFDGVCPVPRKLEHLDLDCMKFLLDSKAYKEAFFIFCREFPLLSLDMQRQCAILLFRAVKSTEFVIYELITREHAFWKLFGYLRSRNTGLECHIQKHIVPFIFMVEPDETCETQQKHYLRTLLNYCNQCKGSHVWDGVAMAIRHSDIRLLKTFSEVGLPKRIPFKNKELAEMITTSHSPCEIKTIIEGTRCFSSPILWWMRYSWTVGKQYLMPNRRHRSVASKH